MVNVSTRIAHINIPDLHVFHSLANRFDYYQEIIDIIDRLGALANKYRNDGYKVVALLNGDVAHRGSGSDNLNDYSVQAIKYLISFFDEVYLNLGNHEFTYYKNNPIWKFIEKIEDPRVLNKYPHITTTSFIEQIKVVPKIEYEDIEIVFTPYKMQPQRGDKKYSHLIMHDDMVSDKAITRLNTLMPQYKFDRRAPMQSLFDFIYCGHNHLTHEKWEWGSTVVYNLASLGRSSVSEIDDADRLRMIPVIIIEGGKFSEVREEFLTLHKREHVVNMEQVELSREAYLAAKEAKEMREDLRLGQEVGVDPITSIQQSLRLNPNKRLSTIFDLLEQGKMVSWMEVSILLRIGGANN